MYKNKLALLILLLTLPAFGQISLRDIGAYAGIGNIKGNSPAVTSFTTNIFFDVVTWLDEDLAFRFAFFYARKFEALLPDQRSGRYYPFHKGFSLKAVIDQELSQYIFLEEGIGLLALNDRTFSDTDKWGFGTAFSVLAGLDFRNIHSQGFKVGVGLETGNTFTQTTPSFLSVHVQGQYYF